VRRSYSDKDAEKEPTCLTEGRPVRRDRLRENLFNASVMECCSASVCVCTCPDCGERYPTGAKCDACVATPAAWRAVGAL
jgi:hypothetical protein